MKSENAEDRRALLRGGRRYVCAYGCARAWATLTFTGTSGAGVLGTPSSDFDSHLTFDIAFIAVSILVVLLFRRLVPLNENRVVKAVSSGCMAAASLLCVATAWIPGASLGLMVCGFLLVPAESLFGTAASSYLIAISYSLMSFLVMFLLFDIAKRLGVAIVAFMAIKNAEQLLQLAGGGATDALGMLGLPASTEALAVTVIVSVLILAATVLLFSEKELASKWGVSILEEGGLVQRTAEEERAAERVEELSRTYRLSPREQEVLALLAEGKTGRAVQQELFIAEGAFKAHTRHIYEKMGINSRKELFDLLGVGK